MPVFGELRVSANDEHRDGCDQVHLIRAGSTSRTCPTAVRRASMLSAAPNAFPS